MLDELTAAGEIYWIGDGPIGDSDGWVRWYVADQDPLRHTASRSSIAARSSLPPLAAAVRTSLTPCCPRALQSAIAPSTWMLVGAGLGRPGDRGHLCPRSQLAVSGVHRRPSRPIARTHRTRLAGGGLGRTARTPRFTTPTTAGRWSLVQRSPSSASDRLASEIFAQLDRYGVVTRGSVLTENAEGGFRPTGRSVCSRSQASVAADTSSKAWVRASSP